MDGRMDGWTDGRMDRRRDGRTEGQTDGWTDGQTDGRTDRWMDRRTYGWMDGRTDGWTDGRMDGDQKGPSIFLILKFKMLITSDKKAADSFKHHIWNQHILLVNILEFEENRRTLLIPVRPSIRPSVHPSAQ